MIDSIRFKCLYKEKTVVLLFTGVITNIILQYTQKAINSLRYLSLHSEDVASSQGRSSELYKYLVLYTADVGRRDGAFLALSKQSS